MTEEEYYNLKKGDYLIKNDSYNGYRTYKVGEIVKVSEVRKENPLTGTHCVCLPPSYGIHSTNKSQIDAWDLANFTKSPLWRLMND
jgi:hypothetical protein